MSEHLLGNCKLGGDVSNDCAECVYSNEYHMVNGECVKRYNTYELSPMYDHHKSFYGRAFVDDYGDGHKILYSYNTKVAEVRGGEVILYEDWCYGDTTMRHTKEFLRQAGYEKMSKHEIAKRWGGSIK